MNIEESIKIPLKKITLIYVHRGSIHIKIPVMIRPNTMKAVLRKFTRYRMATSSSYSTDSIGIVGLGLMGHGICQVAAQSNLHSQVIAYESSLDYLQKGKQRIESSLAKLVTKDKLSQQDMDRVMSNIHFTTNADDLNQVDYIVEAIIENMDLKRDLYSTLGKNCKPSTMFASNTSSLSITDMSLASGRPEQFVGVHFFNPVQIMKLVEVIYTPYTDPVVFDACFKWAEDIGKVAVRCGDTPGFIVNRLLVPSLMQAMLMVDRKDATVKDIDLSLKLGAGHPMGPLHLADYIGLDTCYFIVKGWMDK
jgi:3-hydroxyacyl-CoA dehydrogenase